MRTAILTCLVLLALPGCRESRPIADADPPVIAYSADCPHIQCLAGRVIAETDPRLTAGQRAALWRQYGLRCGFEWNIPEQGFTYHELTVRDWTALDRGWHALRCAAVRLARGAAPELKMPAPLSSRELPELIAELNDDPRIHWAAPDALLLEWAQPDAEPAPSDTPPAETEAEQPAPDTGQPPNVEQNGDLIDGREPPPVDAEQLATEEPQAQAAPAPAIDTRGFTPADYAKLSAALASLEPPYGASFVDDHYRPLTGGLAQWKQLSVPTAPLPDFEYYRLCSPDGTQVQWASPLWDDDAFKPYTTVYGTGEGAALAAYRATGSPQLSHVTVCLADTGSLLTHADLAGHLYPNSVDANYSSYVISRPIDHPLATDVIAKRDSRAAIGFPRGAIQGRPASHGTCTAGIIARCTDGFEGPSGDAVRIMPVSVKSERTYAISGIRVKSPISAFLKLVACLSQEYPVNRPGVSKSKTTINDGDVRVVSTSACIPRKYFSGREWRVVKPLVEKAAKAIQADLSVNDRTWVFAAGNEREREPAIPGNEEFVLAVSACMPFDPSEPWELPATGEGANLGAKCVAAPGYAIITSTLYDCPNLGYLPADVKGKPVANFSVPPRHGDWVAHTNRFCATSAATPQVGALAALIYAQDPTQSFAQVIQRIMYSTAGRSIQGDWGQARGLIDYRSALGYQ